MISVPKPICALGVTCSTQIKDESGGSGMKSGSSECTDVEKSRLSSSGEVKQPEPAAGNIFAIFPLNGARVPDADQELVALVLRWSFNYFRVAAPVSVCGGDKSPWSRSSKSSMTSLPTKRPWKRANTGTWNKIFQLSNFSASLLLL